MVCQHMTKEALIREPSKQQGPEDSELGLERFVDGIYGGSAQMSGVDGGQAGSG